MKFNSKVNEALSDHEESGNEESENEEPAIEESENEEDPEDVNSPDDEEGDEVGDDEDFADENTGMENVVATKKAKLSLGGGNKKIVLKATSNAGDEARRPAASKTFVNKSSTSTGKLINAAIKQLNERSGSSIAAITKFIVSAHPDMNTKRLRITTKRYIKQSLENGTMVQIKQSFKLSPKFAQMEKKLAKEKDRMRKEKAKQRQLEKKKDEKKKPEQKQKAKPEAKSKTADKNPKSKTAGVGKKPNNAAKTIVDTKASKKPKLDNGKAAATGKQTKGGSNLNRSKTKLKNGRKSINLVIRNTPPKPKIAKKLVKPAAAAASKKKSPVEASTSAAAAEAVKSSGKSRRK